MPSWRPDTTQQCLWLGPDRHRRRRGHPGTNAKCFAYSCVNRYPLWPYDADGLLLAEDAYTATDGWASMRKLADDELPQALVDAG